MVEQENSSSAVFSDQTHSNARLQNALLNPWFVKDSTHLLNEEQISNSYLKVDILENECSAEECLDSSKQYLSEYSANDVENWEQPLTEVSVSPDLYFEASSPLSFWGTCPLDLETMKMDDVFQVDKDDLVQSPTLAELNANDESLFDSFDCFLLAEKRLSLEKVVLNTTSDSKVSTFNDSQHSFSKSSSLENYSEILKTEPCKEQHLDVNEKDVFDKFEVIKNDESNIQTVPSSVEDVENFGKPHGYSIAKKLTNDQDNKVKLNVQIPGEKCSENISELPHSMNNDLSDSEEDSDIDADNSSDAGEDSEEESRTFKPKHASANRANFEKKRSRYFWQYNIQAKGPKGPKLKLTGKSSILHNIPGVGDPIFSANCPVKGVKHSGKARKGDGNDLTPNPKKLYNIGNELEKLNSLIDDLVPVNELPVNARTKSRKEKNKLASRACRLKKKAQHEANKLKLFGLQEEQKTLLTFVSEIKKLIKDKVLNFKQKKGLSLMTAFEMLTKEKPVIKVAGCSANFVNDVLQCVSSGDESGGLNLILMHDT